MSGIRDQMAGGSRAFTLGQVLSVAGDRLLCPIGEVYEILNYLTGDNLYTRQLPRAARECRPHLLTQHPQLANVDTGDVTRDNWESRLTALVEQFGAELELRPIPPEDHEWIDPVSELAGKMHPDNIIVVEK